MENHTYSGLNTRSAEGLQTVMDVLLRAIPEGAATFDGPNAEGAAKAAAAEQFQLYRSLLNVFLANIQAGHSVSAASEGISKVHRWLVPDGSLWKVDAPNATEPSKPPNQTEKSLAEKAGTPDQRRFVVSGPLPVLTESAVKSVAVLFTKLSENEITRNQSMIESAALCYALIYRRGNTFAGGPDRREFGIFGIEFAAALARVDRHVMSNDVPAALRDAQNHLARQLNQGQKTLTGLEGRLESAQEHYNELIWETSKLQEAAKAAKATIETSAAKVVEELKLSQAKNLWQDRAKIARRAFIASSVILALCLVGAPIAIWLFHAPILEFVQLIETTEPAGNDDLFNRSATIFGRLALIALPVAFIIWMIRILVRFNTRSLLLMDDASQRRTILDTYLFLIEQKAAEQGDRAAVLEALFRRVPGHGADTIEPPDFVDLIKLNQTGNRTKAAGG